MNPKPYVILPPAELEGEGRVSRDIRISIPDLPFWMVEAMFRRIHLEMGRADLGHHHAILQIEYLGLRPDEYYTLLNLKDILWFDFDVELIEARLYRPKEERGLV